MNRIKFNHQVSCDFISSGQAIHYVSALAFKLTQSFHQPPARLAAEISSAFQQLQASTGAEPSDQILQKFTVWVAESGWLHFQLSDSGMAEWLQQLLNATHAPRPAPRPAPQPAIAEIDSHTAFVWPLLLTHARCSTLLSQADQARRTLKFPDWLNAAGTLRCQQPAEWQLIEQISDTLDALVQSPTPVKQTVKLAIHLSEAFQTFDARCRILGNLRSDPSLAEVRLGLVQITQYLLRLVLEQHLGLAAPLAL